MSERTCACHRDDARDCYAFRYAPIDDLQRSDFFSIMDQDDDQCECGCHYDEYGDDDYDDDYVHTPQPGAGT